MADAHSLLVGGSIASRRIACPASFQESLKSPHGGSSIYAEEGTALHEVMTHLLRNPKLDPPSVIGKTFNKVVITADLFDDRIVAALAALAELEEIYGGGFKIVALERRVDFPGIPGAFGTADVILQSKTHTLVVDWKFGAGVQVEVVTAGELNAQALFYASGSRTMFKDRKLVIAIIQPTFDPPLTHAEVSMANLQSFEATLIGAVANSLTNHPTRKRGEHCRFANCKATCVLWTGPLLDLTVLGKPPQPRPANMTEINWGEFLAAAKHLVDSAIMYKKDIDEALMEHLRAGGKAPGYGLKPAVKNRKWLDDTALVARQLKKLGLKDEQIWQHKLQTFQVVDAAAKKLRVEVPESLRPRPVTTDLVLTSEDDPAAVSQRKLTEEFTSALKRLSVQHQ